MALSRVHTWAAGEVLLASDLNAEYNNLLNNAADLVSPFTKAISMGGFALNFDAANTIAMTATTSGVSLTGGTFREPVEDTITAFATGGQANATALSAAKKFHRISVCATTDDSVKLPTSTVGQWHYIRNDGAAAARVFGTTPDTINSVATATGVPLPAGMGCLYVCTTAGNWTASQSPVSVSGNFAVTFTATAATNVTLPTTGTLAILGANTFTGAQTTNATTGFNESKTTVASAATPDIWTSTGNVIDYTGTVTATGFAAAPQAGVRRSLVCAGAAVFTAGANMLIQGVVSAANYTATAGDIITVTAITTTQFRLFINPVTGIPGKQPTRQVLTSGTGATYTTPSGTTRINVRMVGGGGSGATSGANGTNTTFSTLTAGAGGGALTQGGAGGAAGTAAGGDINIPGMAGQTASQNSGASVGFAGLSGGNSVFGGAGQGGVLSSAGTAAATNSGSGGGSDGVATSANQRPSGAAGGYVEKLILAPSTTYTYTVGAGGAGGTGGSAGAAGIIIVDEFYT